MSNETKETKELITAEQVDAMITPGEYVHVFDNPSDSVLVGVDYPRAHLLELARENGAEIAGTMARGMEHGVVVWMVFGEKRIPLFVSTAKEEEEPLVYPEQIGKREPVGDCPDCGRAMSMGAPHDEAYVSQMECHWCGKIIGRRRGEAA